MTDGISYNQTKPKWSKNQTTKFNKIVMRYFSLLLYMYVSENISKRVKLLSELSCHECVNGILYGFCISTCNEWIVYILYMIFLLFFVFFLFSWVNSVSECREFHTNAHTYILDYVIFAFRKSFSNEKSLRFATNQDKNKTEYWREEVRERLE